MRLISKAFKDFSDLWYKSSLAQQQLIIITSTWLFTCLCEISVQPQSNSSKLCLHVTEPQYKWELIDSHIGSPSKSKGCYVSMETKYLPLLRLVLEQGSTWSFCNQVLLRGECQTSSSPTDCQGFSASTKFTFKIYATKTYFWMTFCQGLFNYCHPLVYL